MLQEPSQKDDNQTTYEAFDGIRVGNSLPLCCPVHRSEGMEAPSAYSLRIGFCRAVCDELLTCGHQCSLQCHWPKLRHNSKCSMLLESPCKKHPDKIECYRVYENVPASVKNSSYNEALLSYKCPKQMDVVLSCGHSKKMKCWEESDIINGITPWPECKKVSPTPYLYENCRHTLKVTCAELKNYNENPASVPPCTELVHYMPPCGHSKDVSCNSYNDFTSGTRQFVCSERINMKLPRCGHDVLLSCPESIMLKDWSGSSCEEVGRVIEGKAYGPRDYVCRKKVRLVRSCGHETEEECNKAFELAKVPMPCPFKVEGMKICLNKIFFHCLP